MKRVLVIACIACAALAAPALARAAPCGLPDAPLYVDYAGGEVPWRGQVFAKPGVVGAVTSQATGDALRAGGAQTVYFEINLPRLVGTSIAPADPEGVAAAANAEFDRTAAATGCATPLIALNELLGPTTVPSSTPQNAQYRANVLTLLQTLAGRGARSFLLLPSNPNTSQEGADWYRQAAQYADIVREVYFNAPDVVRRGPILGNRMLRQKLRIAAGALTGIGVPPSRVGIMLGFQSAGFYGRAGLQPLSAWLEFVKWNALAAKQVAGELGLGSVWSWGWGTFSAAGVDPDKQVAACVYLWTRGLCDAPAVAGANLNTSLTEGQIALPSGMQCTLGNLPPIYRASLDRATAITGDRQQAYAALLARSVQRAKAPVGTGSVLKAERSVVATKFRGRRSLYLAALAQRHATLDAARGIIADELARQRLAGLVGDVHAWTVQQQQSALDTAVCAGDDLPPIGDVRLSASVPFLKLAPS